MSSEQSKARNRGRYGEIRLQKKLGAVKVGLQKTILMGDKVIQIPPDKHPDLITPTMCVEVKYRKSESKQVRQDLEQAQRNCLEGYLPALITGKKKAIISFDFEQWREWYG